MGILQVIEILVYPPIPIECEKSGSVAAKCVFKIFKFLVPVYKHIKSLVYCQVSYFIVLQMFNLQVSLCTGK